MTICLLAILATGCSPKAKKERYLQQANQYFDAGKYDEAEIEYIKVLRMEHENLEATDRLGIIYFEQGRFQRAFPFLARGGESGDTNLEARLALGRLYLAAGKLKEAGGAASFVLDRRPDDGDAPLLLAETAFTPEEIAATRERLQKLTLPQPKRAAVEVAMGNLALRAGDSKGAEEAYKRAQSIDPKFSPLYSALGRLYLAQNNVKEAEQAFKTAAGLSSVRSPRRLQYAQFELQNGNLEAAKQTYEDIVQKAPDSLPALLGLASVAFEQRKYDEAATDLNKVLARDPQNAEGLMVDARLKLVKGEMSKAIAQLERLAGAFPRSPQIHFELALAYLVNNETERAIGAFNQALVADPHFVDATLALAELKIRKGDIGSAVALLKRLVQEQPKAVKAQLLLADAYRLQGDLEDALQVYRQLAGLMPQSPEIQLLTGMVLVQQGQKGEARKAFARAQEVAPDYMPAVEQLVELDLGEKEYSTAFQRVETQLGRNPKAPEPLMLEAKIFLAQGNTNKAETALLKAIELQPDSRGVYLLLAQLYVASHENEKALADLKQVLAKNPNDVSALMLTGVIRNEMKDYNGARDFFEKLLAINPNFGPALNNLAYLYSEHFDQLDKAYAMASRARDLRPYDAPTADTLGWILFQKRQYSRALVLLQESAGKLSTSPEVEFHLGMTHYMLGEEEPARAALEHALQAGQDFPGMDEARQCLSVLAIDIKSGGGAARASLERRVAKKADDPIALARLAAIYEHDGDAEKAASTYEAALKINPDNAKVLLSLAGVYSLRTPQWPRAFELAKKAHELAPDDPQVSHLLGRLAGQTGDHKWALTLLEEVARNQPGEAETLFDLAEARYNTGQISGAQMAMQQALQAGAGFARTADAKRFLDMAALAGDPAQAVAARSRVEQCLSDLPGYVPALMVLGMVNEQKPDAAAAERNYEEVLSRDPDFTPAEKRLAILYLEDTGKDGKAYEMASKAREAFPKDTEVAKVLGIADYRRGDYAAAADLLKESDRGRKNDAQLTYYLGMAQYQLKSPESKDTLQRALDLNLPTELADEVRRVLAQLK